MDEDYKNNIGFLIHDVARLMRNLFDKRMSELGLTRSQWWVLNYLYFNEGINQSDFSKLLDLEKAPLSRLLDRMEKKGWIVRKNDKVDKRIKTVFEQKNSLKLTSEQQQLLEKKYKSFSSNRNSSHIS